MKQQKFTTLIMLFLAFLTFGQSSNNEYNNYMYHLGTVTTTRGDHSAEIEKITSKMYLSDNYLQTKIDDEKVEIPVKYNIYRDKMEFSKNGQTFFLNKESVKKLTFVDLDKNYEVFKFKGELKYFETHNSGNNRLLSREIIKFVNAERPKSHYQKQQTADFKKGKDKFYIKFNNTIVEIPSKNSNFYSLFGKNKKKIKKFIKSNKLSIKKVDDLKKIIEYYNTI